MQTVGAVFNRTWVANDNQIIIRTTPLFLVAGVVRLQTAPTGAPCVFR
jgi:hypothetical protein